MDSVPLALTYNDVLIRPRKSSITSRRDVNTKTRLTKKLDLNIPIISANMDTVTESEMAISLARLGGIGILHRFMSVEDNVEEVKRVKRAQNLVIENPYTVLPTATVKEVLKIIEDSGVSGLLVADSDNKLLGILSHKDLFFGTDGSQLAQDLMTPREKLVTAAAETTIDDARKIFAESKIEKLPLVREDGTISGLITFTDLEHLVEFPLANTDEKGQLIVGASIGVKGDFLERAEALVEAGVDVLVIDIAHGHSDLMLNAISEVRERCGDIQLIGGNVATADGAKMLCEAGVDAVKVGVGPGTICITRLVTGCGVPQLTAVMEAAGVAREYGVPVIADGGVQRSGDIVKAIGAGADTVMVGGSIAGTKESPGVVMNRGGKKFKVCRGSASFAVAQRRKQVGQEKNLLQDVTPEGVESVVPYKGELRDVMSQFIGGLRSGMSYTNSTTIAELQNNCDFMRITSAGVYESGAHDLQDVK